MKNNFFNKFQPKPLIFLLKYFIINMIKDLYKIKKKLYNAQKRKEEQNGKNSL